MNTTSQFQPDTELTLVMDQGSHASRVVIFSLTGELIWMQSQNVSTTSHRAGHFEQDADEILKSLQNLLHQLPAELRSRIKNCGLCTQRSTAVAWHRTTGQTLSPAISWRDLRDTDFIESLRRYQPVIQNVTGLPLSGHYSAAKFHWLLEHNNNVKQAASENQLCLAPLASFLMYHLLQERPFTLDHSNAQRTLLFDIQQLKWDDKLLQHFEVSKTCLPDCKPVNHDYGVLKALNIPLTAVCGDQNAAAHAFPELQSDDALINIGTGAFILSRIHEKNNPPRLLRSVTNSDHSFTQILTEGTVNGAGSALSWAQQVDPCATLFKQLDTWLEQTASPPIFINTVSGLGSPWWCDAGEPEYISNNTPAQAERYAAIIESIVFLIYRNIEQLTSPPQTIHISGGLSQLNNLCQKLADICHANVIRFESPEASARGTAWLVNQQHYKNNSLWTPLDIDKKFIARKNTQLVSRYQQFVGELQKRCDNS